MKLTELEIELSNAVLYSEYESDMEFQRDFYESERDFYESERDFYESEKLYSNIDRNDCFNLMNEYFNFKEKCSRG